MRSRQVSLCFAVVCIVAFMLTGCSNDLEREIISTWPNGEVHKVFYFKSIGEVREKVKEERFYENGVQEMSGEFSRGERHGAWSYWFKDGKKWTVSTYENGLRVGETTIWRESGVKNYEGSYSKGKPHGTWTFYDLDGSRVKDVLFEYGEKVNEIAYQESLPFNPKLMDSLNFELK